MEEKQMMLLNMNHKAESAVLDSSRTDQGQQHPLTAPTPTSSRCIMRMRRSHQAALASLLPPEQHPAPINLPVAPSTQ